MYALVGSTAGSGWQSLLPILENLGCQLVSDETACAWLKAISADAASARSEIERFAGNVSETQLIPVHSDEPDVQLKMALAAENKAKLLLFYERPEYMLLRAMAEGVSPESALDRWRASANSILRIYHANRQRAVVVNVGAAIAHQADFCSACCEFLGVNISEAKVVDIAAPELPNNLHGLLAAQAVSQQEETQDAANMLEASSVPIGPYIEPPKIDCEDVYYARGGPEPSNEDLTVLAEENSLFSIQLRQLQEELERYYLKARDETEQRAALEAEKQRLEKKLAWKQKELALARSSLATIYQSKSWKLTRPIRVIGRLIRGQPLRSTAA